MKDFGRTNDNKQKKEELMPIKYDSEQEEFELFGEEVVGDVKCKEEPMSANEDAEDEADEVETFLALHECDKKCKESFSVEELKRYRMESQALNEYVDGCNRLNLTLLACLRIMLRKKFSKHNPSRDSKVYENRRCIYMIEGEQCCKEFFLFAHTIGAKRWKNLLKTYSTEGVIEKRHKLCNRKPKRTTSLESTKFVKNFLLNFAHEHGLSQSGHAYKKQRKVLPSNTTKKSVYEKYTTICHTADPEMAPVSRFTFMRIWKDCCADIVVQQKHIDVCANCGVENVSM